MEEQKKLRNKLIIEVEVDTSQLDNAIEKANQLVELLERVETLSYKLYPDADWSAWNQLK